MSTGDLPEQATVGPALLGLLPERVRTALRNGESTPRPYEATESDHDRVARLAGRDEQRRQRWLRQLPARFAAATMETLSQSDRAVLTEWFGDGHPNSPVLLLTGATGVGKTWMGYALGDLATRHGMSATVATVARYMASEKDRMFGRLDSGAAEDAAEQAARVRGDALLVLDDLGVEGPSDWGTAHLTEVLDARGSQEKATVVTTNLSPERILQLYGPRLFSRITDRGGTAINVTGPDRRHTRRPSPEGSR